MAAAAERRAAEARAEGLQRELSASEGRLEESARLLASNQQVIKWLNKELNDAQMLPGGTTSAAAAAVAGAGVAYDDVSALPLGEKLDGYNFGGIDASVGRGLSTGGGGGGGGGRDNMFTAGIRESLTGGVRWDLRGTTLDGGNRSDDYVSYRGEATGGAPNIVVQGTPDHAGRSNRDGGGIGTRSKVVTPESADASDPAQASSRLLSGDGKHGGYEGDRDDELGGRLGGGALRGIPAF